jgi:hypothetical protein
MNNENRAVLVPQQVPVRRTGRKFLQVLKSPTCSPTGFLAWAGVFSLAHLISRILGLREYVSILCGTSPSGDPADSVSIVAGMVYVMLYFIFVIGVPILILASGIMKVAMDRMAGRKRPVSGQTDAG